MIKLLGAILLSLALFAGLTAPANAANGLSATPDRANGLSALPDRANGLTALPDRANGLTALPDRANGLSANPAGVSPAIDFTSAVPDTNGVWISVDRASLGTSRWAAVYKGRNCTGGRTEIGEGEAAHGKSVRSLWRGRMRVVGFGTFVFTTCDNPLGRAYINLSGTKK